MVRDGTENQKQHKIPVPTNYRMAAKYLRQAIHEKKSIKSELVAGKHFRTGRTIMHRLTTNMPQINAIMTNIELLKKEPKLNEWLARVLIGELLFGRGELNGMSLPVECVRRYESEIFEEYEKTKDDIKPLTRSLKEPRFVRINTIALNLEGAKRMMEEEGWILVDEEFADYSSFLERMRALGDSEYMVDFHFKDMLVFPWSAKNYWARSELVGTKFFLQNKACLVPTYLLNPVKKSVVLDMCSAPGLKATHLACLMKNKGRLYAVEMNDERYKVLCQYTTDFGVIKTIHGDCLEITDEQVPGVQYILIDPSCSGSGMLNRIDASEPVDEDRLYKLSGLQYKLLTHAMNGFPNAKRIVYSTCSIHEQENERVVESILRHNGHFKLLDAREELGKEWLNLGSEKYPGIGERCLYARTEIDLTIGMFVAVFERCAEGEVNEFYVQNQTYREKNAPKKKRDNDYNGEEAEGSEKPKKKKSKKQNY
ncbi:28S rRNA (cytosine-C(5))-methyltransferase-like [Anopheles ziemanni]|uniref:28S rRNA (cytosine-C(5))-methyltransferase-like n=1 Tax=Anopheles coustani TaxID=139045 RepID=UPI00265AAB60|nr:28S rRNA (cytosine-C(5))-methyltransferase-like [Anopheles coustani]XP_058176714.1 28S rRNA (cytosine-C(5))-methyltransferase-like [Anopheles ziemanni]